MRSSEDSPRRITTVVVFLLLVAVPVAALLMTRAIQGTEAEAEVDRMSAGMRLVVGAVLAVLGSVGAIASYLLVLFTACFTFRFDRPVYAGFKRRLYVANIVVPLIMTFGAIGIVDATSSWAALVRGGTPPPWWITAFPTLIFASLSTTVFNIWSPVGRRLVANRLAAHGISRQQLAAGIYLGIADAARRDWTKTVLEDDVGMLWIEPGRLTYKGDVDEFSVTPADVWKIERVVVSSSLAAYVGLRHVVLHLGGGDRRVRLHVQGQVTLAGLRRATDRLADRLLTWKAGPSVSTPAAASA